MGDDLDKPCADHVKTLRDEVLNPDTFVRFTATGRQRNSEVAWEKVTVRPSIQPAHSCAGGPTGSPV